MAWTDRYVDASAAGGGTGTSPADPWTLAEAHSNSTAGMRVNIKAGTYTVASVLSRSFSGTTSNSVWWRGYKTTTGDLDDIFDEEKTESTDIPLVNITSGYLLESGGSFLLSSIAFKSSSSARPAFYLNGASTKAWNCRFIYNLTTGGSAGSVKNQLYGVFANCFFENKDTSNSYEVVFDQGVENTYINCFFTGSGCKVVSQNSYGGFHGCVFDNLYEGITNSSRGISVNQCTFRDISQNAINTAPGASLVCTNNYFSNVSGAAIASSSLSSNVFVSGNVFQNVSTQMLNIYESTQVSSATDGSDLFVDSSSNDFTLQASSNGYGSQQRCFGYGASSFRDRGAIQHQDPSGGGGATVHPLYAN